MTPNPAAPSPDDPDMGTAREDKFYPHSIPKPDQARKTLPGMTEARPGTLTGGTSEQPDTPITDELIDDDRPHDMSSDLHNPQNDDATDQ